jgi:hypothetical protein
VFFSDPAAMGLQGLDAPDAAAAEGMVLDQHPDAQVHAVDGALVTDENRHRMANLIESWVLAVGVRVFDALVLRVNLLSWLPGWWELFEQDDRLVREVRLRVGGAQRVSWADFTPISPGWPEIQ